MITKYLLQPNTITLKEQWISSNKNWLRMFKERPFWARFYKSTNLIRQEAIISISNTHRTGKIICPL